MSNYTLKTEAVVSGIRLLEKKKIIHNSAKAEYISIKMHSAFYILKL